MSEHVIIRKLEHLTGTSNAPRLGYAVETRASRGPAHKLGAFPDDPVWIKLHGGLVVGKARIRISWVGEYSSINEIRSRTRGAPIHDVPGFWVGRPKAGYAAVAELHSERWVEPHWAGPRTYGYEWVVLESDKKRASWLEEKPPPRGGEDLLRDFLARRNSL
ncbi:MAG TPA: hypothetical protein VFS18_03680 [Actinomycetota bacterium]|nr:hypothetical protein [Actinomycetota bacterium]